MTSSAMGRIILARDMAASLTTFTLWRFPTTAERAWAFVEMGLARPRLMTQRGLVFWKLVGAGAGAGFALRPDWSRYGLVAVWRDASAAEEFFARATLVARYRAHSDEEWTVRLTATHAKGAWSGEQPFTPSENTARADGGPVAVITRATLRWRRLAAFWSAVPSTSAALERAPGLCASVGIGEIPYLRQATFSLWRDDAALRDFAYRDPVHREVIRRTRDEGWYAEELFARFRVVGSAGSWHGRDPLKASVVQ